MSMVQGEVYQVETKGDEFIALDSGADVSFWYPEIWSEWLPGCDAAGCSRSTGERLGNATY